MYKRRRRKGIKEEKVDIKRQDEGAGGAFMHRGEDGSQARKTTTPALVKMPKIKIKSVDKKIPLFESHRSALCPSVCVCVCMCAFPFRQFINFANQGYHQEQEKKFVAVSKKASRYTVLAPALETAPWIWVSDS
jgi:hypothetical protein